MNKKLIAAAVASVVAAPTVASAEAKVYGRINNAIKISDPSDSASKTDISGVASRFGVRYNKDIGNGLTVHGTYEFGTTTDKEKASDTDGTSGGIEDIRIATAGVSGAFGRIDIGNQWSAYFNSIGTYLSPTYSLGYYLYSSVGGGPLRTSNTIKYSNSFGPVSLQLDVRVNDSETAATAEKLRGDGAGIGVTVAVSDNVTLAAAYDSEDNNEDGSEGESDRYGFAINASYGSLFGSLGWQNYDNGAARAANRDIDSTFLWLGGDIGNTRAMVGFSQADDSEYRSDNDDSSQVTWGVYHNMGGGLRLYYEATDFDKGTGAGDESTIHLLGMRVDF